MMEMIGVNKKYNKNVLSLISIMIIRYKKHLLIESMKILIDFVPRINIYYHQLLQCRIIIYWFYYNSTIIIEHDENFFFLIID